MVISNHFVYEDLVHHPIDSQPIKNRWLSGSRWGRTTLTCWVEIVGTGRAHLAGDYKKLMVFDLHGIQNDNSFKLGR